MAKKEDNSSCFAAFWKQARMDSYLGVQCTLFLPHKALVCDNKEPIRVSLAHIKVLFHSLPKLDVKVLQEIVRHGELECWKQRRSGEGEKSKRAEEEKKRRRRGEEEEKKRRRRRGEEKCFCFFFFFLFVAATLFPVLESRTVNGSDTPFSKRAFQAC